MRAYPIALRERVLKAYDEGRWTIRELAERFKVGEWWIYKLKRQRSATGEISIRRGRVGQPRHIQGKTETKLRAYVQMNPDSTLEEIREAMGLSCSLITIHNTLRRMGYRYKKNAAGQRTRTL